MSGTVHNGTSTDVQVPQMPTLSGSLQTVQFPGPPGISQIKTLGSLHGARLQLPQFIGHDSASAGSTRQEIIRSQRCSSRTVQYSAATLRWNATCQVRLKKGKKHVRPPDWTRAHVERIIFVHN